MLVTLCERFWYQTKGLALSKKKWQHDLIRKSIQLSIFVTHYEGKKKCHRISDQAGTMHYFGNNAKKHLLF